MGLAPLQQLAFPAVNISPQPNHRTSVPGNDRHPAWYLVLSQSRSSGHANKRTESGSSWFIEWETALTASPHLSRKAIMNRNKKCPHGHRRHDCRECKVLGIGGSSICEHNRNRYICKECRGSSICEHDRQRAACRKCKVLGIGGGKICTHNRIRNCCSICGPAGTYERYRSNAARRSLSFTITLFDFEDVVILPCMYCGEPNEPRGIDRWDSSIGYEFDNCCPCCARCNYFKMKMSGKEFIALCNSISRYTSRES